MRRFTLTLIATLAFSATMLAQQSLPFDPNVRRGKLENGLTYYIRHNERRAQLVPIEYVPSFKSYHKASSN